MIDKENLLDDTFRLSDTAVDLSTNNAVVDVATQAYFKGGHWGQCLELLQHLCQYSENIVLVLGEPGLGKSTLKQALITTSGEVFKYFALDAEDYHEVDALLRAVAIGFDVGQYMTQVSLAANLATASARDDKVWVLLLDNAHLLSDEILQALINLFGLANTVKTHGKSRLRLVLFGQMGLEQKLEAAKLQTERQDNSHVLELEPLSANEVEAYLQYKWRFFGNKAAFPFDGTIIKKIAELSAGNPKIIERLARDQMAGVKLSLKKKQPTKSWSLPKIPFVGLIQGMLVIAGLAGLAIFLLKPMLINSANNQLVKIEMPMVKSAPAVQLAHKSVADESLAVAEDAEAELPKSVSDILQAQTASTNSRSAEKSEEVLPRVLELEKLAQQKFEQAAKLQEQKTPAVASLIPEPQTTNTQTESDVTANVVANKKPQNAENKPAVEKPKLIIVANNTREKTAVPTNTPESTKKIETVTTTTAARANSIPAKPIQSPVSPESKITTSKSAVHAGNRNPQQEKILSMPSSNFTLQLLGAAQVAGIEQFIKKNKLESQAYYYRSTRQNQPWYILLYGNYPTRTQAKAAIAQLPTAVRGLNPWVRDIASVKKALPKTN